MSANDRIDTGLVGAAAELGAAKTTISGDKEAPMSGAGETSRREVEAEGFSTRAQRESVS